MVNCPSFFDTQKLSRELPNGAGFKIIARPFSVTVLPETSAPGTFEAAQAMPLLTIPSNTYIICFSPEMKLCGLKAGVSLYRCVNIIHAGFILTLNGEVFSGI